MSLGITVEAKGANEIALVLRQFYSELKQSSLLNLIGNALLKWVNDNFVREGIEVKWKPLSPATIALRRKRSSKILQDTGRLRMSFVAKVDSVSQTVAVGTEDVRAPWHHYGTPPREITPKHGDYLTVMTPAGWRRVRKVKHPGLPSRPLLPSEHLAKNIVQAAAQRWATQLADKLRSKTK